MDRGYAKSSSRVIGFVYAYLSCSFRDQSGPGLVVRFPPRLRSRDRFLRAREARERDSEWFISEDAWLARQIGGRSEGDRKGPRESGTPRGRFILRPPVIRQACVPFRAAVVPRGLLESSAPDLPAYITGDLSSRIGRRWGYSGRVHGQHRGLDYENIRWPAANSQPPPPFRETVSPRPACTAISQPGRARIGYLWIPVRRFIDRPRIYAASAEQPSAVPLGGRSLLGRSFGTGNGAQKIRHTFRYR